MGLFWFWPYQYNQKYILRTLLLKLLLEGEKKAFGQDVYYRLNVPYQNAWDWCFKISDCFLFIFILFVYFSDFEYLQYIVRCL
jgi:hypothetical protein